MIYIANYVEDHNKDMCHAWSLHGLNIGGLLRFMLSYIDHNKDMCHAWSLHGLNIGGTIETM
jgi:hypothetical protein